MIWPRRPKLVPSWVVTGTQVPPPATRADSPRGEGGCTLHPTPQLYRVEGGLGANLSSRPLRLTCPQLRGGRDGLLQHGAGRGPAEVPGSHPRAGGGPEGGAAHRGLQVGPPSVAAPPLTQPSKHMPGARGTGDAGARGQPGAGEKPSWWGSRGGRPGGKEGREEKGQEPWSSLSWSSTGPSKWTAGISLIPHPSKVTGSTAVWHLPCPLSWKEDQATGHTAIIRDPMPSESQHMGPDSPRSGAQGGERGPHAAPRSVSPPQPALLHV